MQRVVLDTNFLLLPFQYRIDLEEEIEKLVPGADVFVPRAVISELQAQRQGGSRLGGAALEFARRFKVIETTRKGDEALIGLARKGYIVATNDKLLKEKIRRMEKPVIFLRQKKFLAMAGHGGM